MLKKEKNRKELAQKICENIMVGKINISNHLFFPILEINNQYIDKITYESKTEKGKTYHISPNNTIEYKKFLSRKLTDLNLDTLRITMTIEFMKDILIGFCEIYEIEIPQNLE